MWIDPSAPPTYFAYGRWSPGRGRASRAFTQCTPSRVYEKVGYQLPPRQKSHSLSWVGTGFG